MIAFVPASCCSRILPASTSPFLPGPLFLLSHSSFVLTFILSVSHRIESLAQFGSAVSLPPLLSSSPSSLLTSPFTLILSFCHFYHLAPRRSWPSCSAANVSLLSSLGAPAPCTLHPGPLSLLFIYNINLILCPHSLTLSSSASNASEPGPTRPPSLALLGSLIISAT